MCCNSFQLSMVFIRMETPKLNSWSRKVFLQKENQRGENNKGGFKFVILSSQ